MSNTHRYSPSDIPEFQFHDPALRFEAFAIVDVLRADEPAFATALDISAYSLVSCAKAAEPLMQARGWEIPWLVTLGQTALPLYFIHQLIEETLPPALLRAIGPRGRLVTYEIREDFADRGGESGRIADPTRAKFGEGLDHARDRAEQTEEYQKARHVAGDVAGFIEPGRDRSVTECEFDHAGPRPSPFCVHGVVGRLPP